MSWRWDRCILDTHTTIIVTTKIKRKCAIWKEMTKTHKKLLFSLVRWNLHTLSSKRNVFGFVFIRFQFLLLLHFLIFCFYYYCHQNFALYSKWNSRIFLVNFSFYTFVSRACLIMTVINAEEKKKKMRGRGSEIVKEHEWNGNIFNLYFYTNKFHNHRFIVKNSLSKLDSIWIYCYDAAAAAIV